VIEAEDAGDTHCPVSQQEQSIKHNNSQIHEAEEKKESDFTLRSANKPAAEIGRMDRTNNTEATKSKTSSGICVGKMTGPSRTGASVATDAPLARVLDQWAKRLVDRIGFCAFYQARTC
jgi:hypothetical protein